MNIDFPPPGIQGVTCEKEPQLILVTSDIMPSDNSMCTYFIVLVYVMFILCGMQLSVDILTAAISRKRLSKSPLTRALLTDYVPGLLLIELHVYT